MKKLLTVGIVIVVLGILVSIGYTKFKPAQVSEADMVKATIPGTRVSVAYPAQGFYGHGVKITSGNANVSQGILGSLHLEPTASYEVERGSEFVVMDVRVLARGSQDNSVQTIAERFAEGSVEKEYVKNGTLSTINQYGFFAYKMAEDATVWKAVMLDHEIVVVSLSYTASEGAQSRLAYQNNDVLFTKILEGISIK